VQGTLEDGKEVAVKRLRDSKRTIQELEREISIVAGLRHTNLVSFLGIASKRKGGSSSMSTYLTIALRSFGIKVI
jgi:serine/threonine protein kinase